MPRTAKTELSTATCTCMPFMAPAARASIAKVLSNRIYLEIMFYLKLSCSVFNASQREVPGVVVFQRHLLGNYSLSASRSVLRWSLERFQ